MLCVKDSIGWWHNDKAYIYTLIGIQSPSENGWFHGTEIPDVSFPWWVVDPPLAHPRRRSVSDWIHRDIQYTWYGVFLCIPMKDGCVDMGEVQKLTEKNDRVRRFPKTPVVKKNGWGVGSNTPRNNNFPEPLDDPTKTTGVFLLVVSSFNPFEKYALSSRLGNHLPQVGRGEKKEIFELPLPSSFFSPPHKCWPKPSLLHKVPSHEVFKVDGWLDVNLPIQWFFVF